MEYLAMEVRRLMYTVICFQCLIQLTEGSAYQKYLKLFSYLLTMCICCNVIFSFAGQVENQFSEADQLYERWEKEWREMTASDRIDEGETYYKKLWEDEIIGSAHEEYDRSTLGNSIENKQEKVDFRNERDKGWMIMGLEQSREHKE